MEDGEAKLQSDPVSGLQSDPDRQVLTAGSTAIFLAWLPTLHLQSHL